MEKTSLPKTLSLLKESWLLYRSKWITLTLIFLPAVLIQLFGALASLSLLKPLETAGFEGLAIALIYFPVAVLVSSLASLGVSALAHVSLLFALKERESGVLESYKRGLAKTIPYMWVASLWGFITLGGIMLLAIPGIIFLVWFSLSAVILVNEDIKGMSALLKSREYVKGRWLPVAWRLFFIFVILGVLSWIFPGIVPQEILPSFISTSIVLIIALFTTPFLFTYLFVLYRQLKEVRGGFEFRPQSKTKAWMIIVGIVGVASPLLLILGVSLGIRGAYQKTGNVQYIQEERVDQIKLRDAERRTDQAVIQSTLQIYFYDKGIYPQELAEISSHDTAVRIADPLTSNQYKYEQLSGGQRYRLCITFEEQGEKCTTGP